MGRNIDSFKVTGLVTALIFVNSLILIKMAHLVAYFDPNIIVSLMVAPKRSICFDLSMVFSFLISNKN